MTDKNFCMTNSQYNAINPEKDIQIDCTVAKSSFFPLNLLLFSAGGFFFGAYAAQIRRSESSIRDQSCSKHHLFLADQPYNGVKRTEQPSMRTDLIITPGDGCEYSMEVHAIEDIIAAEEDEIVPFPPLIAPWAVRRGMWAVMPRNQRIYILLDFRNLIHPLSGEKLTLIQSGGDMTQTIL